MCRCKSLVNQRFHSRPVGGRQPIKLHIEFCDFTLTLLLFERKGPDWNLTPAAHDGPDMLLDLLENRFHLDKRVLAEFAVAPIRRKVEGVPTLHEFAAGSSVPDGHVDVSIHSPLI